MNSMKKSMIQKPKINIPGKALLKYVEHGLPKINGVYFAYYKPIRERAMSNTFPIASYCTVVFDDGKWVSNKNILAFLGPLPVLTLDEIDSQYKKQELSLHVYCIGTLQGAVNGTWLQGPFNQSLFLSLIGGEKGEYGFEINQRTTLPNPITRYSEKHDKWIKIQNPKVVIAKMKKLKVGIDAIEKTTYFVCPIKDMAKGGTNPKGCIIKAMGALAEKGDYIFEMTGKEATPIYQWRHGWKMISNKKTKAIKKRISVL